MTHELISPVRLGVRWRAPNGWTVTPADISLSTADVPTEAGWLRLPPTVQIEGGSYSLDGARQLRDVLEGFLRSAAEEAGGLSRAS